MKPIITSKLIIVFSMLLIFPFANNSVASSTNTSTQNLYSSYAGDEGDWDCETCTKRVDYEYEYCVEHDHTFLKSIKTTYGCDSGWLSWCYPGWSRDYYECDLTYVGTNAERETMTCREYNNQQ